MYSIFLISATLVSVSLSDLMRSGSVNGTLGKFPISSEKGPKGLNQADGVPLAIVFCCIVALIQPDISGCQQDFIVV